MTSLQTFKILMVMLAALCFFALQAFAEDAKKTEPPKISSEDKLTIQALKLDVMQAANKAAQLAAQYNNAVIAQMQAEQKLGAQLTAFEKNYKCSIDVAALACAVVPAAPPEKK